jgi:GNAT superfamily N-acetyltransferase
LSRRYPLLDMLSGRARDVIERYWAERFGCSPEQLRRPGAKVVAHTADLRGYAGLYAYRRDEACIVSVPYAYLAPAEGEFAARSVEDVFDAAPLSAILGDAAGVVIGPAAIAYSDASTFRPARTTGVRLLAGGDEKLLRELTAACDATEWDHADIEYDRAPIFGCFIGNVLATVASYRVRSETIASIGIITHPARRGHGYARAAASAATSHALDGGLIGQWQTLEANVPSIAVARALGYVPYCRTIAVRLRSE